MAIFTSVTIVANVMIEGEFFLYLYPVFLSVAIPDELQSVSFL